MLKLSALFLFLPFCLSAQESAVIFGKVSSRNNALPYVNVGLEGTGFGTSTDSEGRYKLEVRTPGKFHLVFSSLGFRRERKLVELKAGDTVKIDQVMLEEMAMLSEMVVTGTSRETYLTDSPVKVEVITSKVLSTSPVSNIIEAVGMVNGIQERVNCGVCGTNDIHINGMEGPYTLVLIDGMPIVSALGSVYGFNGIPSSLVERIEVIKGPSSTLYGSEAVGGVVNIITRDPSKMSKVGLNSFLTSQLESSTDLHYSTHIDSTTSVLLSGNFYNAQHRIDDNRDGFTDFPMATRYSLFNKWESGTFARGFTAAARYYKEDRFGGVMGWTEADQGSDSVYGESILTSRLELLGNFRRKIGKNHFRAEISANHHDQDSWYGNTSYIADQVIVYSGLIINRKEGSHNITGGISGRFMHYQDNTPASIDDSRIVPGIFLQDEFPLGFQTFMPGLRLDLHPDHGLIFSPRLSIKRKFGNYTTVRLNSGTGFRQVNLFTEDHAALNGSRTVVVNSKLKPEQSLNASLSLHHLAQGGRWTGSFDADLFITRFSNKILPDYDADPNLIVYDNLAGHAITRGISLSWSQDFEFPLRVHGGITLQDVFLVGNEAGTPKKERQELTPIATGTWIVSYEIKKLDLLFDYTGRLSGPQRLPELPSELNQPQNAPWYSLHNLQATFAQGDFEFFTGVKNLFNFTQPNPLIAADRPFSSEFDTSNIWGPLQTRRFFIGLRWNLPKS